MGTMERTLQWELWRGPCSGNYGEDRAVGTSGYVSDHDSGVPPRARGAATLPGDTVGRSRPPLEGEWGYSGA